MAKYVVGDFIYHVRTKRGYTQEELAEGICTTGTLSKIENGSRMPSVSTYEALMQRLGEPASLFSVYLGKRELEADNFYRKMIRVLARRESTNPVIMLQEYGAALVKYRLKESPIMICLKAICHTMMEEPPQKVLKELYAALKLTEPIDAEIWRKSSKKLLTFDEIMIWNNIAIQYKRMEQYERAIAIWRGLREYLNVREVDREEMAKIYPIIVYNLAGMYAMEKIYTEAIRHSEEGIQTCIEYGRLFPLPYLLRQKGQELKELGDLYASEECIRKSEILWDIVKQNPPEQIEELTAGF